MIAAALTRRGSLQVFLTHPRERETHDKLKEEISPEKAAWTRLSPRHDGLKSPVDETRIIRGALCPGAAQAGIDQPISSMSHIYATDYSEVAGE